MSKRRADHEAGYVLHTYAYKESSLIVEAFTRRHGRLALLARGARRPRSALRGVLLAFHPLRFSWSGTAELRTLMGAEWSGSLQPAAGPLKGRGLMCGFYLNELLLKLLPREDPHEALFDHYGEALARLSEQADLLPVLPTFGKRMLAEHRDVSLLERDAASGAAGEAQQRYGHQPAHGAVAANPNRAGVKRP